MTSRQRDLLNELRVLAGGKGWLVEEAFQQADSDPVQLRDVVRYIAKKRIKEAGLDAEDRKVLQDLITRFSETTAAEQEEGGRVPA